MAQTQTTIRETSMITRQTQIANHYLNLLLQTSALVISALSLRKLTWSKSPWYKILTGVIDWATKINYLFALTFRLEDNGN